MPDTRYFLGGNLATAANWVKADGVTTGLPVAGDTAVFGQRMTSDVSAGYTTFAAISIYWRVEQGVKYSMGDSSNYIQILNAGPFRHLNGSPAGSAYFQFMDVGAVTVQISSAPTGPNSLNLKGLMDLSSGVGPGNTNIITGTVSADQYLNPLAFVTYAAAVTMTTGVNNGGTVTTSTDFTTWTMTGGGNWNTAAAAKLASGEFTAISGTITDDSSGTWSGALEIRQPASYTRSPTTVSTKTITTLRMDGTARVDFSTGLVQVTNPIALLSQGTGPIWPSNTTIVATLP